jgi:hypothetical protein
MSTQGRHVQWPRSPPASRVARICSRRVGGPAASWEAQIVSTARRGSARHVQVARTARRATCARICVCPDGSSARSYCSTRSSHNRRPARVGRPLRPTPRPEGSAQIRSLMSASAAASEASSASTAYSAAGSHSSARSAASASRWARSCGREPATAIPGRRGGKQRDNGFLLTRRR